MRSANKLSASTPLLEAIVKSTFDLSRALRHCMEIGMKDQRANLLQFHVLLLLREHEGMTMSELARAMHITSPTATSFINRLVRQRWVSRKHDRKNRKLVRLSLTKEGSALLRVKMEEHERVIASVFGLLSKAEQTQLLSLHEKLLSRLAESSVS
jgi:DNA-binding MarR family transcriptional regulator